MSLRRFPEMVKSELLIIPAVSPNVVNASAAASSHKIKNEFLGNFSIGNVFSDCPSGANFQPFKSKS